MSREANNSPRGSKPPSSLALALDHLERRPDTYLFPIKAGKKTPPLISDNLRKASNDPAQIKAWHDRWPGCNWGLALKKSRLVVADIDMKAGKVGRETFVELSKKHGPWPKCYAVMTPAVASTVTMPASTCSLSARPALAPTSTARIMF